MDHKIRRLVTTNDPSGKAVVLLDGPAPNVNIREDTGFFSALLWVTDTTPPDVSGNADAADREIGVPPPAGGSIFRIVEFPPEKNNVIEVNREVWLKEMGLEPGSEKGQAVRHPNMHRTNSIDYAVIMTG